MLKYKLMNNIVNKNQLTQPLPLNLNYPNANMVWNPDPKVKLNPNPIHCQ